MITDTTETMARFSSARVAHLASVTSSGEPHIVPVTFAVHEDVVVSAVDHKPKTTLQLKRLDNIRRHGSVALLADEYDEDWSRLWWARVDGAARVVDSPEQKQVPVTWLCEKYSQYRDFPPEGPVIWIDVRGVTGWAASGGP